MGFILLFLLAALALSILSSRWDRIKVVELLIIVVLILIALGTSQLRFPW